MPLSLKEQLEATNREERRGTKQPLLDSPAAAATLFHNDDGESQEEERKEEERKEEERKAEAKAATEAKAAKAARAEARAEAREARAATRAATKATRAEAKTAAEDGPGPATTPKPNAAAATLFDDNDNDGERQDEARQTDANAPITASGSLNADGDTSTQLRQRRRGSAATVHDGASRVPTTTTAPSLISSNLALAYMRAMLGNITCMLDGENIAPFLLMIIFISGEEFTSGLLTFVSILETLLGFRHAILARQAGRETSAGESEQSQLAHVFQAIRAFLSALSFVGATVVDSTFPKHELLKYLPTSYTLTTQLCRAPADIAQTYHSGIKNAPRHLALAVTATTTATALALALGGAEPFFDGSSLLRFAEANKIAIGIIALVLELIARTLPGIEQAKQIQGDLWGQSQSSTRQKDAKLQNELQKRIDGTTKQSDGAELTPAMRAQARLDLSTHRLKQAHQEYATSQQNIATATGNYQAERSKLGAAEKNHSAAIANEILPLAMRTDEILAKLISRRLKHAKQDHTAAEESVTVAQNSLQKAHATLQGTAKDAANIKKRIADNAAAAAAAALKDAQAEADATQLAANAAAPRIGGGGRRGMN